MSQDALLRALRWENLAERHPVLASVEYFRDAEAEREADQQAFAEFARLGLIDGNRLDPEFRDALVVLSRPGSEFYAWVVDGGEKVSTVLVAAIGRDALLLTRDEEHVRLKPARPEAMAETLVAQFPEHPPARAQSISVARSEYEQSAKPSDEVSLRSNPSSTSYEVRRLNALMQEPRIRTMQLCVAGRDRSAQRNRDKFAVLDLESGRWTSHVTGDSGKGDDWIVAAPATPQLLTSLLYERQQALH